MSLSLQITNNYANQNTFLLSVFGSDHDILTDTKIDPPGVPDDFLHAGPVSRGEGEPEEEAEDVVEVIAEVQEH